MTVTKRKIMWVEDDQLIGALLAQKLSHAGYDLFCATRGKEALDALQSLEDFMPDIIIVDLLLPDMDGFEILAAINKNPRVAGVPRMVLSNLDGQSDKDRAFKLGAKKFMVKAVTSLDEIVSAVKELVH
ncbi:MAG: response regulator [Patescibacteria group bacterium]|nr:response regulator [Patescibacteria group bacterium]